jgi:hypothetical protein
MVRFATAGDNSVVMNAAPRKSLHGEISVEGVARPQHESVGAVLRRTIASAMALRERGLG